MPRRITNVGDAIYDRRMFLNISQQAAGDRIGMKREQWSLIEGNLVSPTVKTLLRIAKALKCDVRTLV